MGSPNGTAAALVNPSLSQEMRQCRGRILVVDDDDAVRRVIVGFLASEYEIIQASNGQSALDTFRAQPFDVLISDIAMPGMDGVRLLQEVRELCEDVPVVLITGNPSIETAIGAVEHRAFKYVTKPIRGQELREIVEAAVQHHRIAVLRQQAFQVAQDTDRNGNPELLARFERAFAALWLAYQPIADTRWKITGYEALLRCEESEFRNPVAFLAAAAELGRVGELLAKIRSLAPRPISSRPGTLLFMNIDPPQLETGQLLTRGDLLAEMADQVVLELTERIPLSTIPDLEATILDLKSMGYRLAVDDLGAGYSGLGAFSQIGPDFVKLDRTLTSQVERNADKQQVIRGIINLCHDLGMKVIAEGIEDQDTFQSLETLGCDLFQGFFIGRPEPLT